MHHELAYDVIPGRDRTAPTKIDMSAYPNVKPGDVFKTKDGLLVGRVVENLTDFDEALPANEAKRCIEERWAPRKCINLGNVSPNTQSRHLIFDERKVVTLTGEVFHQGLIKAFGSPAWINLPTHNRIEKLH